MLIDSLASRSAAFKSENTNSADLIVAYMCFTVHIRFLRRISHRFHNQITILRDKKKKDKRHFPTDMNGNTINPPPPQKKHRTTAHYRYRFLRY